MSQRNSGFLKIVDLQTRGALQENAIYVDRQADAELYRWLRSGKFCFIAGGRQIGKSSLCGRVKQKLRQQGLRCASIELSGLVSGRGVQAWFRDLIEGLAQKLMWSPQQQAEFWQKQGESFNRASAWRDFLRQVAESGPVVLFFDEADAALDPKLKLPEFFSVLRALYDSRGEVPAYRNLSVCFLGVFTSSEGLLGDTLNSPLKDAERIHLHNFSRSELVAFRQVLEPFGAPDVVLDEVHAWTAGHPYMTHRLCKELSQLEKFSPELAKERVAAVVKDIFLDPRRVDDDCLEYTKKRLRGMSAAESAQDVQRILRLYSKVLAGESIPEDPRNRVQDELTISGLCRWEKGNLIVQNNIVSAKFDKEWVKQQVKRNRYDEILEFWRSNGKQKDTLLVGGHLIDAESWFDQQAHVSNDEKEFLQESRQEAARIKRLEFLDRIFRPIIGSLLSLVVVSAVIAIFFYNKKKLELIAAHQRIERVELVLADANQKAGGAEELLNLEKKAHLSTKLQLEAKQSEAKNLQYDLENSKKALQKSINELTTSEKKNSETSNLLVRAQVTNENLKSKISALDQRLADLERQRSELTQQVKEADAKLGDIKVGVDKPWAFSHEGQHVYTSVLSSDNLLLVTGTSDGRVWLWDVKNQSPLRVIKAHIGTVYAVALSSDGKFVASAGEDHAVRIWSIETGEPLRTLNGHTDKVIALALNGRWLLSGSEDKTARIWDVSTGTQLEVLAGHSGSVSAVAFSAKANRAITGSADKTARVWELQNGRRVLHPGSQTENKAPLILDGQKKWIDFVWLNEFGNRGIVGTPGGKIHIWILDVIPPYQYVNPINQENFQKLYRAQALHDYKGSVLALTKISQTTYLASADDQGIVWVWEASTGKPIQELKHATAGEKHIVDHSAWFSADGRYIVTASADGYARLWRLKLD